VLRLDLLYRPRPVGQEDFLPTGVDMFGYILYRPHDGDLPIGLRPDAVDLASELKVQGEVDFNGGED
jgi:hypothetical protein